MSTRKFVVHLARPDKAWRTYCGRNVAAPIECLPPGDHLSPNEVLCDNCVRSKARRGE